MTIKNNKKIVYQDLVESAIAQIKSVCENIDSFPKYVPNELKNGQEITIGTYYVPGQTWLNGKKSHHGWTIKDHTSELKLRVEDDVLNIVSESTIRQQLDEFLIERGLKTQSDEIMTFKNMMDFYNNLASFIAARVVYVTSIYTPSVCVFYNSKAANFPTVQKPTAEECYIIDGRKPLTKDWLQNAAGVVISPEENKRYIIKTETPLTDIDEEGKSYDHYYYNHVYIWNGNGYTEEEEYTTSEITTSIDDLLKAIGSKENVHYALTKFIYTSCCSCSSSSSSSCSSSSSSSVFIAYMDI